MSDTFEIPPFLLRPQIHQQKIETQPQGTAPMPQPEPQPQNTPAPGKKKRKLQTTLAVRFTGMIQVPLASFTGAAFNDANAALAPHIDALTQTIAGAHGELKLSDPKPGHMEAD